MRMQLNIASMKAKIAGEGDSSCKEPNCFTTIARASSASGSIGLMDEDYYITITISRDKNSSVDDLTFTCTSEEDRVRYFMLSNQL